MSLVLRVGAVKPSKNFVSGFKQETSGTYNDADVLEIQLPEHTYQKSFPSSSTISHHSGSCFGLPYHDHNYGMPPPPSPSPTLPSPEPVSPTIVNGPIQIDDNVKTTPIVSLVEEVVEDSITRCICGYLHDDGYMICCDKCSVWQHIDCMNVDRNNIPDGYFCEQCEPRDLDAAQAKILQKRKREELAARNVLSDSSATDTDPEEANNALQSIKSKSPTKKKKSQHYEKKSKSKGETKLKLKLSNLKENKKLKKSLKTEKENIKTQKASLKVKIFNHKKRKFGKHGNTDPWNSRNSPWIDSFENIIENSYSNEVEAVLKIHKASKKDFTFKDFPKSLSSNMTTIADVKKNRKGLQASQDIADGQPFIEFKGKVMLKKEFDEFTKPSNSLNPFVLHYSNFDVDVCVDASETGNEARFIRRSCTPNSEVKHVIFEGKIKFIVVSTNKIACKSEITLPFDYNFKSSAVIVECACVKSNCSVARFWKKINNAKGSKGKDQDIKKKLQQKIGNTALQINAVPSKKSPLKSPKKEPEAPSMLCLSPEKIAADLSSPLKLKNVSALLAASALLESDQTDVTFSKLETDDFKERSKSLTPKTSPKKLTSRRRSRKNCDDANALASPDETNMDSIKQEKKDENADKKEKLEKQSQEEKTSVDIKEELIDKCEDEELAQERKKKMTREERKLEAIMKAFEKMEKRQERLKEVTASKSETNGKRNNDDKNKKNEKSHPCKTESPKIQETDLIDKIENIDSLDEFDRLKLPKKTESEIEVKNETNNSQCGDDFMVDQDVKPENSSPHKAFKRTFGFSKRKRRRSRAYSIAAIPENVTQLSSNDVNTENIEEDKETALDSTQSNLPSPSSAPPPLTVTENSDFKFIKSKKHLFTEWSNKHDQEKDQERMFVQCLPSPHINVMDHLRRQSFGSGTKNSDLNPAGSAKKRWLRKAMDEEPSEELCREKISIEVCEHLSQSPLHDSMSPILSCEIGSPRPSSPSGDAVTPLKKRRLMRESMSGDGDGALSPTQNQMPSKDDIPTSSSGCAPVKSDRKHIQSDLQTSHPLEKTTCKTDNDEECLPMNESLKKSTHHCHSDDSGNETSPSVEIGSPEKSQSIHSNSVSTVNGLSPSLSLKPTRFLSVSRNILRSMERNEPADSTCTTDISEKSSGSGKSVSNNTGSTNNNKLSVTQSTDGFCSNSDYNEIDSEAAGCVTTKSIMDVNSPVTVCVDLNAHENNIQSSPVNQRKTVVNLDVSSNQVHKDELSNSLNKSLVHSSNKSSTVTIHDSIPCKKSENNVLDRDTHILAMKLNSNVDPKLITKEKETQNVIKHSLPVLCEQPAPSSSSSACVKKKSFGDCVSSAHIDCNDVQANSNKEFVNASLSTRDVLKKGLGEERHDMKQLLNVSIPPDLSVDHVDSTCNENYEVKDSEMTVYNNDLRFNSLRIETPNGIIFKSDNQIVSSSVKESEKSVNIHSDNDQNSSLSIDNLQAQIDVNVKDLSPPLSSRTSQEFSDSHLSPSLLSPPLYASIPVIEQKLGADLGSTSSDTNLLISQSSCSDESAVSSSKSSLEGTPVAKKKVSLMEYRKRLKEKPAVKSTESTILSPVSKSSFKSTSTSAAMRKIFLDSSRSATSSTPIVSKSKQQMPTLETLPLFKTAEEKKGKRSRGNMSLTERLRLEFGVDSCYDEDDEPPKKKKFYKLSPDGSVSPPPPPPPTSPPPLHTFDGSHQYKKTDSSTSSLLAVISPPSSTNGDCPTLYHHNSTSSSKQTHTREKHKSFQPSSVPTHTKCSTYNQNQGAAPSSHPSRPSSHQRVKTPTSVSSTHSQRQSSPVRLSSSSHSSLHNSSQQPHKPLSKENSHLKQRSSVDDHLSPYHKLPYRTSTKKPVTSASTFSSVSSYLCQGRNSGLSSQKETDSKASVRY